MMAPIPINLDISTQTTPFGILVPIVAADQGTDFLVIEMGRVDLGGSAGGANLAWRAYSANAAGAPSATVVTLITNANLTAPAGGFRACGTGQYLWPVQWRESDNLLLVIDVEGGSTPASSFLDMVIGGYDDE